MSPEEVPVRALAGRWWRQTDPKYDALSVASPAASGGRCHRKGSEAPLYASSSENASWGELFRQVYSEVSPFEVRRTMSAIDVAALPIVDFEDPVVRELFDVTERMLTSNNYAACRRIADILRDRKDLFGGFVLPSAAVPGEQTLVVFQEWIPDHLAVAERTTRTAPARLLRLFETIIFTLSRHAQEDARRLLRAMKRDARSAAKHELDRILGRRRGSP